MADTIIIDTSTDTPGIVIVEPSSVDINSVGGLDADLVNYDNTTSGLSATDAQAAIDEVAAASGGSPSADSVSYDNTTSGLTATDAQAAIDEINDAKVGTDEYIVRTGNTFFRVSAVSGSDSNLGTSFSPWQTLDRAFSELAKISADRHLIQIRLEPGTYEVNNATLSGIITASGRYRISGTFPFTYQIEIVAHDGAAAKDTTIIKLAPGADDGINIQNIASFIKFQDVTFQLPNNAGSFAGMFRLDHCFLALDNCAYTSDDASGAEFIRAGVGSTVIFRNTFEIGGGFIQTLVTASANATVHAEFGSFRLTSNMTRVGAGGAKGLFKFFDQTYGNLDTTFDLNGFTWSGDTLFLCDNAFVKYSSSIFGVFPDLRDNATVKNSNEVAINYSSTAFRSTYPTLTGNITLNRNKINAPFRLYRIDTATNYNVTLDLTTTATEDVETRFYYIGLRSVSNPGSTLTILNVNNGENIILQPGEVALVTMNHIEALALVTKDDSLDISYDNTTSGLTATNVQDAIDELKALIDSFHP